MIIASVSTIPGRIDGLLRVLSWIPQQTQRPDILLITISDFYPRMKKAYPIDDRQRLETFLSTFSIPSRIMVHDVDIGPAVKLLSAIRFIEEDVSLLSRVEDHEIFIFDDDSIPYPRAIQLLRSMYKRYEQYLPHAVYGLMGANDQHLDHRPKFLHGEYIISGDYLPVDIMGGYRGVLYPAHLLFGKEDAHNPKNYPGLKDWIQPFLQEHRKENLIAMHDDHMFAYYCRSRGIELRVIRLEGSNGNLFYEPIDNQDGIFNDAYSEESYKILHRVLREQYHMEP